MPTPRFIGLDPGVAGVWRVTLRMACTLPNPQGWADWFDRFSATRGDGHLVPRSMSIIDTKAHAGLPNLKRDVIPRKNDPSLLWLLRQFVIANAPMMHESIDGFNGTFLDGLNIGSRLSTDEQRAAFDAYRDRLLMANSVHDPNFDYLLHPDAYSTYLPHDDLRALLAQDDACGFMPTVVTSLEADDDAAMYAAAIQRWRAFLDDVADAERDLYYLEFAT